MLCFIDNKENIKNMYYVTQWATYKNPVGGGEAE